MMGLSVFELMESYNISFEEAQIKKLCPKIYKKLEKINIV